MIEHANSVPVFAARSGSIFKKVSERLAYRSNSKGTSLYNTAMREDGLLHGTMVGTAEGWTAVEDIQPGERVMTFDHGLQEVIENRKLVLDLKSIPEHKAYVMHIPRGALGNRTELRLMPMQEVIIESDKAEAIYGDPFVLMPSLLLNGYNRISKQPVSGQLTLSMLLFEGQQVVQTNGGALTFAHTNACFSPLSTDNPLPREVYMRLSPKRLVELIEWTTDQPDAAQGKVHTRKPRPSAFGGQSIEESYAAVASRMM